MHSMVFFIKRKDGMSPDAFYKYWEGVHGPLVKPWAERHGLTYKQVWSVLFLLFFEYTNTNGRSARELLRARQRSWPACRRTTALPYLNSKTPRRRPGRLPIRSLSKRLCRTRPFL